MTVDNISVATLNRAELRRLRELRQYPAVSLFSPLHRHQPGNAEDPLLLRNLIDEVRRRLHRELGFRESAAVLDHLEAGVQSIDLRHPSEGVAVFATATQTRVLRLPFTVPERIVVDETFATRDLARGLARSTPYRVLALAEKPTRLLESDGCALVEVEAGGFPLFVEGAKGEPTASGGYAPHSSRSTPQHDQFFRRVDHALGARAGSDPLPLVVAGTERDIASFERVTEHQPWIIGRLLGNHERTAAGKLAELAKPCVDAYLAERSAAGVSELAEAIGTGRGVVGIQPIWQRAIEGRGRTLLVEEDFEFPARVVDGGLEPAGDIDPPEVLDDAVDALIDIVTASGGEIEFVEAGALGIHGPVAMLLRY